VIMPNERRGNPGFCPPAEPREEQSSGALVLGGAGKDGGMDERQVEQFRYEGWCDRCLAATTHLFGACQRCQREVQFPRSAVIPEPPTEPLLIKKRRTA